MPSSSLSVCLSYKPVLNSDTRAHLSRRFILYLSLVSWASMFLSWDSVCWDCLPQRLGRPTGPFCSWKSLWSSPVFEWTGLFQTGSSHCTHCFIWRCTFRILAMLLTSCFSEDSERQCCLYELCNTCWAQSCCWICCSFPPWQSSAFGLSRPDSLE